MQRWLPAHHFMVTSTVPEPLRRFIRSHQRVACSALFKASSQALETLARDERHIGGDLPGFFGVLHTWGRTLEYHPHIHYIVAGGMFSTKERSWMPSRIDYLVPVKALSVIYSAKIRDEMRAQGILHEIPGEVRQIPWNVNCQAVGESSASLKYPAPYVFRVAISNGRIVKVADRTVTFRYGKTKSRRLRTMALDAIELIRRFLQHVLPTGFMKIRYFGFMNPNCGVDLETIRGLIELSHGFTVRQPEVEIEPSRPITCPHYGGALRLRTVVFSSGTLLRPG